MLKNTGWFARARGKIVRAWGGWAVAGARRRTYRVQLVLALHEERGGAEAVHVGRQFRRGDAVRFLSSWQRLVETTPRGALPPSIDLLTRAHVRELLLPVHGWSLGVVMTETTSLRTVPARRVCCVCTRGAAGARCWLGVQAAVPLGARPVVYVRRHVFERNATGRQAEPGARLGGLGLGL